MSQAYSPNLFLFQSYVGEVLKEAKKIVKTAPFQTLDPDNLLNNNKSQHIDAFHQYFLAAMGHLRTRQLACSNYEKLIRQALVDRDHIPPSLISSVLAACAGAGAAGGSTSGSSSLGSTSLSATPQGHSLYIGNMIKTMLLGTCQPSGELIQGLNYLLEGTRKKNSILYNAMLQQIYSNLLIRYRQHPTKKFVGNYLQMLLDQVEAHFQEQGYIFATRTLDNETGKFDIALYKEGINGFGKFGRCFMCGKEASHYLKDDWLPICGLGCKEKVKGLIVECQSGQPFNVLNWLLDCLPSGDEAILTFLFRQLQYSVEVNNVSIDQLENILKILIHQLTSSHNISRPLLGILSIIITKWMFLIPKESVNQQVKQVMQNYFKVYLLEIVGIIEQLPISKQYLDSIHFLTQILKEDAILVDLFLRYDSKFFQLPLLARMLNLISQYAKKFDASLNGLQNIVKGLMNRFIDKNIREDHWLGYGQFMKKRQIRKIITTFNKKPINGIKMLKNLLGHEQVPSISIEQPEKQRPSNILNQMRNEGQLQIQKQIQRVSQQNAKQNGQQQKISDQVESSINDIDEQDISVNESDKKDEEPLDSDLIINKRIDQLIQDQDREGKVRQQQIVIDPSRQMKMDQKEANENNQQKSIQATQQPKQKSDKVQSINKSVQRISDHQSSSVQQQFSSTSTLPLNKNIKHTIGPRQISIFIRQNLEIKSWTQADSKLPIPIPSLSKVKVGEYFGSDNPQIRQVSTQFLNNFDFETMHIDDVMRIVMNSYSLPKETQQIERIIGDLSLRLLGKYGLQDDTSIYQYIYLLLMVQTTNHNPQVKENEKLSLQNHLSMSKHVKGGVSKEMAEADYRRILEQSLVVKMKYPKDGIFYEKYLNNKLLYNGVFQNQQGSLSKSILLYLWEYLVIGLVWPGNNRGLFQTTLMMGRQGLQDEQKGFFQALRKSPPQQSQSQILKLAIQYGNDLIGKPWEAVVSLLYTLEQTNDCSTVLDKLFTNSGKISPPRLRDFLHALLQFSSSQVRKDILYTRQLFVLRHINSLIEYNIIRFNELAQLCWPLLKNYFKDICLHPRKQISMAAIDSLKQLSLKLVKLRIEAVPHQALLETFLYVFQRSSLQMKDLIANVLLNLITSDLRGGWEPIYSILDVLDTKDKNLVVKVIGRLLSQIGLNRLDNLHRLHSICIKQLRVCSQHSSTEQLLSQLWDLSSFIDQAVTWMQTIRSIKDIFKISLTPDIITIFVRLCNRCVQGVGQAVRPLDKEVLAEVIDLLLFLLQIRGGSSKTAALIASLDSISNLSIQFQLKYLVGNCGLLQIFRMFLACQQKIPFSIFFKKLVKQIYLPCLKDEQGEIQFEYLGYWCVNQYMNHLPIQLLNLKQNDKDFEQTLTGLLGGQEVVEADKEKQHVLIQFPESHKQYYQKSLMHLVFLDVVEAIYANLIVRPDQKTVSLREKIQVAVGQSFDCAFRVNRLILLRNFLWNNGFLTGRMLPGLLKQEHRTLLLAVKWFPFKKSYGMFKVYLNHFRDTLISLKKLKQLEGNDPARESKGLSVYRHDAEMWISESQDGIRQSLKVLRKELQKSSQGYLKVGDKLQLIQFTTSLLSLSNLPVKVCRECASTLHTLYSLSL